MKGHSGGRLGMIKEQVGPDRRKLLFSFKKNGSK